MDPILVPDTRPGREGHYRPKLNIIQCSPNTEGAWRCDANDKCQNLTYPYTAEGYDEGYVTACPLHAYQAVQAAIDIGLLRPNEETK